MTHNDVLNSVCRAAIFGIFALPLVNGAAAAAEKQVSRKTHHYYYVEYPADPYDNRCDPSQLASVLHEANLCSADEATTIPSLLINH